MENLGIIFWSMIAIGWIALLFLHPLIFIFGALVLLILNKE